MATGAIIDLSKFNKGGKPLTAKQKAANKAFYAANTPQEVILTAKQKAENKAAADAAIDRQISYKYFGKGNVREDKSFEYFLAKQLEDTEHKNKLKK